MNAATAQRLWDASTALSAPFVRWMVLALAVLLIVTPPAVIILSAAHVIGAERRSELFARYRSWLVFIPLMLGPVLLGGAWVIGAVALLSVLCYREFARATGHFRHWEVSALVIVGILALAFATADHWYGFFVALPPLVVSAIAAVAILRDQPQGYIQRVALGVLAFVLFGVCFGHLAYLANDTDFRPILFWLLLCVEANDIFAYIVGKSLGRRKLAPRTSPHKTVAGAVGALLLTTGLAAGLGHVVFAGSAVDTPARLVGLGVILSVTGQLGDLALASVKRDLGIKDWAPTFPGHGGLLDRFNSLLFAAPAVFHYVGYLRGIGLDQTPRIFL